MAFDDGQDVFELDDDRTVRGQEDAAGEEAADPAEQLTQMPNMQGNGFGVETGEMFGIPLSQPLPI